MASPSAGTPSVPRSWGPQDLSGFVDGHMKQAMQSGDIAGTAVVIIKDGRIVKSTGYGFADVERRRPVDPDRTLFRIASVSKLFVNIAVMQQVERGKLQLDVDIARYLDFQVAATGTPPITLRHLMTHRAGFAAVNRHQVESRPLPDDVLERFLRDNIPRRIWTDGSVPAYSNYGSSLAAYIVQRVTGERFDRYVERAIFVPLGMQNSTFRQPIPRSVGTDVARGYHTAGEPAEGFEYVVPYPVGAMSATSRDMALFMQAILDHLRGRSSRILSKASMEQLVAPDRRVSPWIEPLGLGFFRETRDGTLLVGHGGDTGYFHTWMMVAPGLDFGIYVVSNSNGRNGEGKGVTEWLRRAVVQRYVSAPTGDARRAAIDPAIVGTYQFSVRPYRNVFSLPFLMAHDKVAVVDGTIRFTGTPDMGGIPLRWVAVAPDRYRTIDGRNKLVTLRDAQNHISGIATDFYGGIVIWHRVTGWWQSALVFPALGVAILCVAGTLLRAGALRWLRRSRGASAQFVEEPKWRTCAPLAVAAAWAIALVAWLIAVVAVASDANVLVPWHDLALLVPECLTALAVLVSAIAIWPLTAQFLKRRSTMTDRIAALISLLCAVILSGVAVYGGYADLQIRF